MKIKNCSACGEDHEINEFEDNGTSFYCPNTGDKVEFEILTLQTYQAEKEELEENIAAMLYKFEKRYNIHIKDVRTRTDGTNLGLRVESVKIETDL